MWNKEITKNNEINLLFQLSRENNLYVHMKQKVRKKILKINTCEVCYGTIFMRYV